MITFAVEPHLKPIPFRDINVGNTKQAFKSLAQADVEASNTIEGLHCSGMNGFLYAVHMAYDYHRPLILSPDDVWLATTQALASVINARAEELRTRFVKHEGKALIRVRRDEFIKGDPDNDWPGCFREFSESIAEYVGDFQKTMVAGFTTTTMTTKAVSQIVLMDALKSYFNYEVMTRCGMVRALYFTVRFLRCGCCVLE